MSNSPLVSHTHISPHKTSPRNHAIDTITIHCVVGQCSVETLGNVFAQTSRKASSNYGIGKDGRIGMYVEEKDRSVCSSNSANDHRAVTIEVASDTTAPYAVNDKAYAALIDLVTDICKRNKIKKLLWKADKSLIGQVDKQNMTVHRWFSNKTCPGDYLYERHPQIASEVNRRLGNVESSTSTKTEAGVTATEILDVARSWLGYSEANGKFKEIIDLYNSHKPLARSYKVQYNDAWCATFVSACAIKVGAVGIIGTECGCEQFVNIFKKKGIWIEDGSIKPQVGDIILFNWDDSTQPNNGWSDHIGFVEKVTGNTITCIEGNKNESVSRRTINLGWGNIRGFARPKYKAESNSTTSSTSTKTDTSDKTTNATAATKEEGVCTVELKVLKQGAKNNSVKALQNLLIGYGYSCGSSGMDGSFGPATVKAVKAYQKDKKLTVDGSVGPATWNKLLGIK